MRLWLPGRAVYGFGERFDKVNQAGLSRENLVYEKFTNQGASAYLPVPFCMTDAGVGVYLDTDDWLTISTEASDGGIALALPDGYEPRLFVGRPLEILDQLTAYTGRPILPPDWAFGLWMSANRWDSQAVLEEQVGLAIQHGMKPSVVVMEAWSDETTFYRFDTARFPDPAGMIARLHEQDIHLVLWQIPVLKKLDDGQVCPKHEADCAEAVSQGFVAANADGTPYVIPEGHWFSGSMIPDFTNPEACEWWFGKRQYLLDMGVDGFKTDGGEFVYDDSIKFFDGRTGLQMRNGYAAAYTQAYTRFIGGDGCAKRYDDIHVAVDGTQAIRVLFSRAGYAGSQTTPLHWAGDQVSTWAEMRHVLTAGLNAGLSGIPFWGFDIAGFASELPTAELYLRSFAMACFCPIMQWHSEPIGGQFADVLASQDAVNDRSPWNIAKRTAQPEVIPLCRRLTEEREKLLPYINEQALVSSQTGRPMMAALVVYWPEDTEACAIDDEYMFGSELLVAPVLEQGQTGRDVYLPAGIWRNYYTESELCGPCRVFMDCEIGDILVWRYAGRA